MVMDILTVSGLCKRYSAFALQDVSFSVGKGQIVGFIGRNGAGKTTTLKSLLNLVHPDAGEVSLFGLPFAGNELAVKRRVGFVSGGMEAYTKKRLRAVTAAVRPFYANWDERAYRDCLSRFELDESKTPDQLSAGMRVKYALTLALSHRAELMILDEPTSGLDPISRDDLLELFLTLARQGVGILFSTHITSDLEKYADRIVYIQRGRIAANETLDDFTARYRSVALSEAETTPEREKLLIGKKIAKHGFTALVRAQDAQALGLPCAPAALEDVMVHLEKEDDRLEGAAE